MTDSPIFWVAVLITLGMGARGYWHGFSKALARLQLLVLALVATGALLAPVTRYTREWLEWPLYFHQLVFGGLLFAFFYSLSCWLLGLLFDRKPILNPCPEGEETPEQKAQRLSLGSRIMGLLLGILAGAAISVVIAFLAGVRPDFDVLNNDANRLLDQTGELSAYGYEQDAFDTPDESPVSALINALVLSPIQGVKLLQATSRQPEFAALLENPSAQRLMASRDIVALTDDPTFDQLIATAPVQDLWRLQRELEALTDRQLERETAAQLVDMYHRVNRVRQHPRVIEALADGEFRQFLQSADLSSLTRDARVLELGDVIIGARSTN